MARRTDVLDLAVLGLLHDSPMHGYELRKQLAALLGTFRVLSYGTLYPCLRRMTDCGWIGETTSATPSGSLALTGRRGKIVYQVTESGRQRFSQLLSHSGTTAWEDDVFDVHFAFFGRTDAENRLRILEGRRSRLLERLERVRAATGQGRPGDPYALELQRHGQESMQRELAWLDRWITAERDNVSSAQTTAHPPRPT